MSGNSTVQYFQRGKAIPVFHMPKDLRRPKQYDGMCIVVKATNKIECFWTFIYHDFLPSAPPAPTLRNKAIRVHDMPESVHEKASFKGSLVKISRGRYHFFTNFSFIFLIFSCSDAFKLPHRL